MCISYLGCARGGPVTPFRLQGTMDTRLKVHGVPQNGSTGCGMRCLVPKSSRRDDYEGMRHCCNVLSARACVPTNVVPVGSAVLGEESEHDLE